MSVLFSLSSIWGYVSSVIFIGEPVTYSGPIGALTGFLIYELWNYKSFKKEWKFEKKMQSYR